MIEINEFKLIQIPWKEMLELQRKQFLGIPSYIAFDPDGRSYVYPPTYSFEIDRLRQALAFACSVIKSGESWTEACEQILKIYPDLPPP